jgi:hypothetical protein
MPSFAILAHFFVAPQSENPGYLPSLRLDLHQNIYNFHNSNLVIEALE